MSAILPRFTWQYWAYISQLSLINKDTSILKLQSIPVAPIDSPYRIKMLFENMGVNSSQLHPKAGKNLGGGDENKKLTLIFF